MNKTASLKPEPATGTAGAQFEPRIVAFLCNWCSYAGADLAGISRIQYPASIRVIRVPCSGRVDPFHILKSLQDGADGVLVSGCHPGDCHYLTGNYVARRRFAVLHDLLDFVGIEPGRVSFSWVSAAEGERFAEVVRKVTERVRELGPNCRLTKTCQLEAGTPRPAETTSPQPAPRPDPETLAARAAALRQRCRELLTEKSVAMVLGYEPGSRGTARPAFITSPADADRLIFDQTCSPNLANHLLKVKNLGKIAIIAKGCDSRSLLVLIKEKQIERDRLHILGIGCQGVVENGLLSDSCTTCRQHNPVLFDEMIAEPVPETSLPAGQGSLQRFRSLTPDERWHELSAELSRCIRCYACRQVCPNCYCPVCFVDENQPRWVGRTTSISDNMIFHIMRALHMAGRCVECGACARACPVGIDLMKFNREVSRIVRERFGASAGMDPSEPPALASFRPDDPQEFIL